MWTQPSSLASPYMQLSTRLVIACNLRSFSLSSQLAHGVRDCEQNGRRRRGLAQLGGLTGVVLRLASELGWRAPITQQVLLCVPQQRHGPTGHSRARHLDDAQQNGAGRDRAQRRREQELQRRDEHLAALARRVELSRNNNRPTNTRALVRIVGNGGGPTACKRRSYLEHKERCRDRGGAIERLGRRHLHDLLAAAAIVTQTRHNGE